MFGIQATELLLLLKTEDTGKIHRRERFQAQDIQLFLADSLWQLIEVTNVNQNPNRS